MVEYTKGLHEIAGGISAWLAPDGGWGWSNAGIIEGEGASFLVDTLFDLHLTREMLDEMAPITTRSPLRGALNTHANGDHCYGNQLLPADVPIYATAETGHEMHDAPPSMLQGLVEADLGPVVSPFLKDCFGPFDFSGITVRDPDVSFTDALTLDIGGREVQLVELGPAHTPGDSVAYVPDAGVVFGGDLLFIGGTPIAWVGAVDHWIEACDRMIGWDPSVVVPGHGPVTDVAGILQVKDYLSHVLAEITSAIDAGRPWLEAAKGIDLDRFASLPQSERVVVTTYQVYRDRVPETPEATPLELFGKMAAWKAERVDGR